MNIIIDKTVNTKSDILFIWYKILLLSETSPVITPNDKSVGIIYLICAVNGYGCSKQKLI